MEDRVAVARRIIDFGLTASDLGPGLKDAPPGAVLAAQPGVHAELLATQHDLSGRWPAGLAPTPRPIVPAPDPAASLPRADYVVITWTVAELAALADVLAPGGEPRRLAPV
jgi:hypothetical protein